MWLYKLTNKMNGKAYIGTSVNPISHRISRHLYAAKTGRNMAISHAIAKYGLACFVVECLAKAGNYAELMKMETMAISDHGTRVPKGYNITAGGRGCYGRKHSKKTKALIAKKHLGKRPWNFGIKTGPMSEATKKKQSLLHMGQRAWNKGVPHTAEDRRKMIESHKGKINHNAKTVSVDGKVYSSICEAARLTQYSPMQIRYGVQTGKFHYV